MIKHILYPILGSSSVESGMTTALQVTAKFGGHVEAICCRRHLSPSEMVTVDEADVKQYTERTRRFIKDEKRRVSHARKAFDAVRDRYSVAYDQDPTDGDAMTASWEIVTGNPVDEVIRRAGTSDLVVVGRADASVGTLTQSLVETALFASGAPVLVAPQAARDSIATNVLIGWNRSSSAGRAVRSALPLLRKAKRVEILMVATGAKAGPEPHRMALTLQLHGIQADVTEVSPGSGRVSNILRERASDMGADLLIMGAYSHSRMRQLMLGGVTRDILSDASLPVLMTH